MKIIVQRVSEASVSVDGKIVGKIDKGFMCLVGVMVDDTINDIQYCVHKISGLRIFDDENDHMNLSLKDVNGSILSISQFTLAANCHKGFRPSFSQAAKPQIAKQYYELFNQGLKDNGIKVETGIFQSDMKVSLVNDGPVTIIIDSKK